MNRTDECKYFGETMLIKICTRSMANAVILRFSGKNLGVGCETINNFLKLSKDTNFTHAWHFRDLRIRKKISQFLSFGIYKRYSLK